jgi:hypothetical protein
MVSDKQVEKLKKQSVDSIQDLETAAQFATAAAYPHAVGSPADMKSKRCLNFRIETGSFEDLKACLMLIGAYNYFDGERVARAFKANFPTDEVDGGDDGVTSSLIAEIGREGSPVLYVRHGFRAYGDNQPPMSEEEFESACEQFGADAGADEVADVSKHDWQSYKGLTYRFWWD